MILWRICSARHAELDGAGGLVVDGRWHFRGAPIIYASSSVALATLEVRVHTAVNLHTQVLLRIECPEDLIIPVESLHALPEDWAAKPRVTQRIGSDWLASLKSAALSVPSA